MILVLLLGIVLVGMCATLVGRAVALPRLRALERLSHIGAYGFAAPAEGEQEHAPRLSGAMDGVARRLGSFFSGRLRGISEAELRRELLAAGMYRTSPTALAGYRIISAISFPVAALWLGAAAGMQGALVVMTAAIALGIGWLAPLTVVRRRARRRLDQVDYDLPELVDVLVVTVEAGMSLAGSMQVAAERLGGPLGEELRLALQEQSMGLSTDRVLAHMVERSQTPGMRSFVRSVRQGESLGVSIGQIMRSLALEMRKQRRANAEERAQKAPIKILFPLVALIFPAMFVVLLGPAVLSFTSTLGGGS